MLTITQQQRKLTEFIERFEAQIDADPKNIKTLETLAQIYTLTQNTDKAKTTIERLIAASPNDPVYQAFWLSRSMGQERDYETLKKSLDEMIGLTPEARFWYIAQYASNFYQQGQKEDAEKLAAELENAKVTDLNTGARIVNTLTQMGKLRLPRKYSFNFQYQHRQRRDNKHHRTLYCPLSVNHHPPPSSGNNIEIFIRILRLLIFEKDKWTRVSDSSGRSLSKPSHKRPTYEASLP